MLMLCITFCYFEIFTVVLFYVRFISSRWTTYCAHNSRHIFLQQEVVSTS